MQHSVAAVLFELLLCELWRNRSCMHWYFIARACIGNAVPGSVQPERAATLHECWIFSMMCRSRQIEDSIVSLAVNMFVLKIAFSSVDVLGRRFGVFHPWSVLIVSITLHAYIHVQVV
jgi:hypothetical protein